MWKPENAEGGIQGKSERDHRTGISIRTTVGLKFL